MSGPVGPERTDPLDGEPLCGADAVEVFAAGLRALREQAGPISFRAMARATHYSSSALAQACSGRRLPSEALVAAFAEACGADATQWAARLARAQQAAREPGLASGLPQLAESGGDGPGGLGGRRGDGAPTRRLAALCVAVVLLAAGLAGGYALGATGTRTGQSAAGTSLSSPSSAAGSPAAVGFTAVPSAEPSGAAKLDGSDPIAAGCTADAQLLASAPVLLHGGQVGALEIKYSPRCRAGWARLYLYPAEPRMIGQTTVRSEDGRSSSFADLLIGQVPIYTNVIVPGPGGCLAASAVLLTPGNQLVGAQLPCTPLLE